MPWPVTDDNGSTGAPARPLAASSAWISACAAASRSGVTRSHLVSANRTAGEPQQIEDRQVLARLRHRAVVGGDDQQHMVDAGGAGQHVAHQFLVARHVDEAQHLAVRQRLVGKAQVDSNAAFLLLLQAVGVHAGERLHERRLAVVDVACGSDDQGCDTCGKSGAQAYSLPGGMPAPPGKPWPAMGQLPMART